MPEIKPGGAGPEETDAGAEFPPDLEQEKREIEARIDQHIAKLQEIAEVFGIDTSQFSDEDDQRFANSIQKRRRLADYWYKKQGIKTDDSWGTFAIPKISFQGEGFPLDVIDCPFDYTYVQAEHIREVGRVTDIGEANLLSRLQGNTKLIFTGSEIRALEYFGLSEERSKQTENLGDLGKIEADLIMLDIQNKARKDELLKHFVDWLKTQEGQPAGFWDFSNYLAYYGKEYPDKASEVRKLISDIIDQNQKMDTRRFRSFRNENLSDLMTFAGRVLTHIADIYNTRVGYLIDSAKSGRSEFREIPEESTKTKKVYQVDPNFQFTEEDARKAKELNLPWSRIEKEMEEESAKE